MGRLLAERKALLIEVTEDTTQPQNSARRFGSIELLVINRYSESYPSESHVDRRSGSLAKLLDAALKL